MTVSVPDTKTATDIGALKRTRTLQRTLLLFLLLTLVGFSISVELTRIHYFTHTDPDYHAICTVSDGINCETVALSAWSVFLGIPVSLWGISGYVAMLLVAGMSLMAARRKEIFLTGALLLLTSVSLVASVFLAVISFTRIDSLCLFCIGTYAVNAVLFVVSLVAVRQTGDGLSVLTADIRSLMRRPLQTIVLIVLCAATPGIMALTLDPYWETPGWMDISVRKGGTSSDGVHWMGAEVPTVIIVEYTDYECPFCRTAHQSLRRLLEADATRIRIVHRHFPLDHSCNPHIQRPFHDRACEFSRAVECAGTQGKFWEMNDAIFSAQDIRKSEDIDIQKFALQLGLDRGVFVRCMQNPETDEAILRDIREGVSAGVKATPTFFVNGEMVTGRLSDVHIQKYLK